MGLRDEMACYSHDLIGHKLTSFLFWFLRLDPISAPLLEERSHDEGTEGKRVSILDSS